MFYSLQHLPCFTVRKAKDDVSEDFFLDKMLRRVTGAGGISVPSFTSSDAEEAAFSNANLLTKVRVQGVSANRPRGNNSLGPVLQTILTMSINPVSC